MDHVWDAFYTVGLTSSPSLAAVPIFPKECQRDLNQYYEIDPEIIGQGSFACIRRVKLRRPSDDNNAVQDGDPMIYRRYYACKTIPKSKLYDRELFRREVYNLNRCQGQAVITKNKQGSTTGIIRLLDVLEDRYAVHIITELCNGGELLDYVSKEHERTGMGLRGKALSPSSTFQSMYEKDEGRCASIVHQILMTFLVLHQEARVCHRDAKASNFVFCSKPSYVPGSLELKLIDFGLSKFVGSPKEEKEYRRIFGAVDDADALKSQTIDTSSNGYGGAIWDAAKTVYNYGFTTLDAQTSTTATSIEPNEKEEIENDTLEDDELEESEDTMENEMYSKHYQHMTSEVGTPYYVAPEVLRQQRSSNGEDNNKNITTGYTTKCDVWSVGVLAYLTLTGSLPVMGTDEAETIQKLMDPDLEIDFSDNTLWEQNDDDDVSDENCQSRKPRISNHARKFCQALLQADPSKRPTAREALGLDWITMHCGESVPSFGLDNETKSAHSRLPCMSISVGEAGGDS